MDGSLGERAMSSPIEYSFDERLQMSQGVSANTSVADILITNIPGACSVNSAHSCNDRQGTDWWVEHSSGKHLSIDCKVRAEDWQRKGSDDLALEIWSVVEKKAVGWTRKPDKRTDYVLWLWTDTGRWCLIPFPFLCQVFGLHWEAWALKYKTSKQKTTTAYGSYHSQCVFVPRLVVWREIYQVFGGNPAAKIILPVSP